MEVVFFAATVGYLVGRYVQYRHDMKTIQKQIRLLEQEEGQP